MAAVTFIGGSRDRVLSPVHRNLALGGMVGFAALVALSDEEGPVLCPFRRTTDGYCPFCGLTRSGWRLIRGDVVGSLQYHPYLVVAVAQVVTLVAVWTVATEKLKRRILSWAIPALIINSVGLTGVWIYRLIDGSVPIPFIG